MSPLKKKLKTIAFGKALDPTEYGIFHKLSLVAFFAWVGLGSDALSSSSYGPPEAFLALGGHTYLALFVAVGTALTILVISTSYSQIIELFPTGGGGYLVASKLLSPKLGMLSGCALLIDYVLTIAISIASGVEAIFSFLPPEWGAYKLGCAIAGLLILTVLNMRGVKESVTILAPIFILFVATHAVMIFYALMTHTSNMPVIAGNLAADAGSAIGEVGLLGVMLLLLHSYSMGAGTYTGLEAVSNGIPILRDPKVQTAKKTMKYMAASLIAMVLGLMVCYILYDVGAQEGKTLNAVLVEKVAYGWGTLGQGFVVATLVSEAALLFVAAQTGFIDGPRVLGNMALDRWVPTRFAMLSDRLVTHKGVLLISGSAITMMLLSGGSVHFIVVLYSITVFLTFFLSQSGMVRYWWRSRAITKQWQKKLFVNGLGMLMTFLILASMVAVKFSEGGWITILITTLLAVIVTAIRRHYDHVARITAKLDDIIPKVESKWAEVIPFPGGMLPERGGAGFDASAKTAIVSVSGFNGVGIHTLSEIFRAHGGAYKNFVFIEVGVVDAGVFKGATEIARLREKVASDVESYVKLMKQHGYYAEGMNLIGVDVVEEITKAVGEARKKFPDAAFFGGQIILPTSKIPLQWLHNYTLLALEKRLRPTKMEFTTVPIKVG